MKNSFPLAQKMLPEIYSTVDMIMKGRPLLVLLLFAASAVILAGMYYAATREGTTTRQDKWAGVLSDLDACSRRKHVKSAQYDHFAGIARQEREHDAERLFRAMAHAERLQEYNCANAIVRLGGRYAPPEHVTVFRGTTDDNLRRSIDFARRPREGLHADDIERALQSGNRYAARVLIWARSGDMRHLALMETCRRYFKTTGRRISYEYAMIDGVNDSDRQADLLAGLLKGLPGHVNLIPLNDVVESPLKPSHRIAAFQKRLESHGITATVRRSLGGDIDASCGQLRRKAMEEEHQR